MNKEEEDLMEWAIVLKKKRTNVQMWVSGIFIFNCAPCDIAMI